MAIALYHLVTLITTLIFLASSLQRWLLSLSKVKYEKYFYAATVIVGITLLQVVLLDAYHFTHPLVLFLLHFPVKFLAAIFYFAFSCYYLNLDETFKKYSKILFLPFYAFTIVHLLLFINALYDYSLLKREVALIILQSEDLFSIIGNLAISVLNYFVIKQYESTLGSFSYTYVIKQTQPVRNLLIGSIILTLCWLLVSVIAENTTPATKQLLYFILRMLVLVFYGGYIFYGMRYIRKAPKRIQKAEEPSQQAIQHLQMVGMAPIFTEKELTSSNTDIYEVTGILSYFATSLFDKNKVEEVLWDVVENCITYLHLEDCVICMYTPDRTKLVQKAAFGNKNKGKRKVLSPMEIPVGEGIVGRVAATGKYLYVPDTSKNPHYQVDDMFRYSKLVVPIYVKEEVVGVLDAEHSQKAFFQEEHIFKLQLIAKLLGKKLENLKTKSNTSITNDSQYIKALDSLMTQAHIYRDAQLSLHSIASKLNISSSYLSQIINQLTGKNFSDYVNQFRVEDTKKKLRDPAFADYTIIAIGLEAGFNAKSTFYTAFKKHVGVSPKQYRKQVAKVPIV